MRQLCSSNSSRISTRIVNDCGVDTVAEEVGQVTAVGLVDSEAQIAVRKYPVRPAVQLQMFFVPGFFDNDMIIDFECNLGRRASEVHCPERSVRFPWRAEYDSIRGLKNKIKYNKVKRITKMKDLRKGPCFTTSWRTPLRKLTVIQPSVPSS